MHSDKHRNGQKRRTKNTFQQKICEDSWRVRRKALTLKSKLTEFSCLSLCCIILGILLPDFFAFCGKKEKGPNKNLLVHKNLLRGHFRKQNLALDREKKIKESFGNKKRMTLFSGGNVFSVGWHPDARKIVVLHDRDGSIRITLFDVQKWRNSEKLSAFFFFFFFLRSRRPQRTVC